MLQSLIDQKKIFFLNNKHVQSLIPGKEKAKQGVINLHITLDST